MGSPTAAANSIQKTPNAVDMQGITEAQLWPFHGL